MARKTTFTGVRPAENTLWVSLYGIVGGFVGVTLNGNVWLITYGQSVYSELRRDLKGRADAEKYAREDLELNEVDDVVHGVHDDYGVPFKVLQGRWRSEIEPQLLASTNPNGLGKK